jgi:uncharacterized protein (DUF1778 family)
MGNKTSQLQIRVTPEQKVELKGLASSAGLNVSEYVLATVLPAHRHALADKTEAFAQAHDRPSALSALGAYLTGLAPSELSHAVSDIDVTELAPTLQNHVAAMVELVTRSVGLEPPGWAGRIQPQRRPHFARDLPSLRPHQMRVTPVPFKRRNLFIDTEAIPLLRDRSRIVRPGAAFAGAGAALVGLNGELRRGGISAELCMVGGRVLTLAYTAEPDTRSISALFQPPQRVRDAIDPTVRVGGLVATGEAVPGEAKVPAEEAARGEAGANWLARLAGPDHGGGTEADPAAFVELSNLRLYGARADYVLAVKCASLRLGRDAHTERDIQYLLRHMGVGTTSEALAIVGSFFTPRQQPAGLEEVLERALGQPSLP